MRRWMCFFLAVCSLLTLCACGQTPPEQDPDSPETAEEESQEPEAPPEPEPYSIYDPTVIPEGGSRDGVTFGDYAHRWMRAGAKAVGGCCRTVDSHIREVTKAREIYLKLGR